MNSKNLLILVSDSPFGRAGLSQNLLRVLGISVGYKEHKVNVLLTGDAVYFAKMPADDPLIDKVIRLLEPMSVKICFDGESVKKEKIDSSKIHEDYKVLDRGEILKLYKKADITLSI